MGFATTIGQRLALIDAARKIRASSRGGPETEIPKAGYIAACLTAIAADTDYDDHSVMRHRDPERIVIDFQDGQRATRLVDMLTALDLRCISGIDHRPIEEGKATVVIMITPVTG